MSLLPALPLLPLAAALWLALSRRQGRQETPGVSVLVALAPIAAAIFLADASFEVRYFLTTDVSVFELDESARASLLLFGALWLVAGLPRLRHESGPAGVPTLLALSGAITVALASEGPAILYGMLLTGFGLCAIVAGEAGTAWRQPARTLAVLLVASYLLIFEVLLHVAADPLTGTTASSDAMIILAVVLSAGIPPAHAWQIAALSRASAATSVLVAGVPAGVALFGGHKLLSGSGNELALACLALAVAGAAWSTLAGAVQRSVRAMPTYATAATASLLLIGLPGAPAPAAIPWITLSLLTACGALVVIRLQRPGFARNATMTFVVLLHGIAAGQFALLAAGAAPGIGALPASLVAALATMLVALTALRIAASSARSLVAGTEWLSALLAAFAAIGLGVAWISGAERFAAAWPAAAGIGLGLLLSRLPQAPGAPPVSPRFPSSTAKRISTAAIDGLTRLCEYRLPRMRDRLRDRLLSLWQGRIWAARIARLESLLAVWPATALGVILLAIAIGLLLLG